MRNRDPFAWMDLCGKCGLRTGKQAVKPGILCLECKAEVGAAEEYRPEENFGLNPQTKEESE